MSDVPLQDRGKIAAQIIEAARAKLDQLDLVGYGTVAFCIRNGKVYRMEVNSSIILGEE